MNCFSSYHFNRFPIKKEEGYFKNKKLFVTNHIPFEKYPLAIRLFLNYGASMMKQIIPGPYNISREKYSFCRNIIHCDWFYGESRIYPLWISFLLRAEWERNSEYHHDNPSRTAFEMPLEGDLSVEIDGISQFVHPGELLILPAGTKNTLRTGPSGHCRKIAFGITGNLSQSILVSFGLLENRIHRLHDPERIIRLLDGLGKLMRRKDSADAPHAVGLLMEILAEIAEQSNPETIRPEVADAIRIIEYNLNRNISVSELADLLKISRKQLFLLFREHFSVSPKEYMMNLRMKQAEIMLRETKVPVKNIAEKNGYHSGIAFARAFRKYSGRSPKEFRQEPESR